MNKKGISPIIGFLLIIGLFFVGYFVYVFFVSGEDLFLRYCNRNRSSIERAVEVFSITEPVRDIQGVVTPEKITTLDEFVSSPLGNPSCTLGGDYFITGEGKIFCNLHGFGDRIPENSDDKIDFPEDEIPTQEEVDLAQEREREAQLSKILDKEIEYTTDEERTFFKGVELENQGNVHEAIGEYQKAISINSEEPKYYEALIWAFRKTENYDQAKGYAELYLEKFAPDRRVKQLIDYIESREYFNLRLKRIISEGTKVIWMPYNVSRQTGHIARMDLNGDNKEVIKRKLKYVDFTIGNQDDELIFFNDDGIFTYNIKNDNLKEIFLNSGRRMFDLFYSKESQTLTFSSIRGGGRLATYSLDRAGTGLMRLTPDGKDSNPTGFSPDGRKVLIEIGSGSSQNIATVEKDGRNLTLIDDSVVRQESPVWADTRNTIAFASKKTERNSKGKLLRDIFIYEVDNDEEINISNTPLVEEFYPNWSKRNDKIAYAAVNEEEYFEIFIMNSDGSQQTQLTNFERRRRNGWDYYPKFSFGPDDNFIVFSAGFRNKKNIYILEVESKRVLRLTEGGGDNVRPVFVTGTSENLSIDL
ncbi:MAG: hypothetical protein ACQESP_01235 [Candidatus Muiribacteriota bacterium]